MFAVRTILLFCLIFSHHQATRRYIPLLTPLYLQDGFRLQIVLAMLAFFHGLYNDLIRLVYLVQGFSFVSFLSPGWLPTLLSSTPSFLPDAVRSRFNTTTAAV